MKVLFEFIWGLLQIPIIVIISVIALFAGLIIYHLIIGYIKGRRIPKGAMKETKERSAAKKLLIDFPKQKADDIFNSDPDSFGYQGLVVFCGRQGQGKTISMVEWAMRVKAAYPKSQLITNFNINFEDAQLEHWRQLVTYKNGKLGVLVLMDELQNWFSSNQSKNFPPEMLQEITQNRKQRRQMCGTAQNFYLLAKPIRSQCTEVRDCRTFFGCITVVSRKEPILDCNGDVKEWRKLGRYFFVHSSELREAYDTYKVIENLAHSGFKDSADFSAVKF